MTRISSRLTQAFVSAVALVMATASSFAADYPDRAIKLIVPWAAGGDTDLIFRPLAPLLQKYLGQPIVIANVGGASGTVGEREASGGAPDGYTLFGAHDFIHSVYFAAMTDIKYDAAFEPVCMVSATPSVITVGLARFDEPVFHRAGRQGRRREL
jgi:tripartite-type tricarboxylate transporter receptor subunit TctC